MTDQELKLELLKIAKAQNPHENPLDVAEMYYQWVQGNMTFEEENMTSPGYNEQAELVKDLAERLKEKYLSEDFVEKWNKYTRETGIVWEPTIKQQVQSIIKTAQSKIFLLKLEEDKHKTSTSDLAKVALSDMFKQKEIEIYKNAFNKLLEL